MRRPTHPPPTIASRPIFNLIAVEDQIFKCLKSDAKKWLHDVFCLTSFDGQNAVFSCQRMTEFEAKTQKRAAKRLLREAFSYVFGTPVQVEFKEYWVHGFLTLRSDRNKSFCDPLGESVDWDSIDPDMLDDHHSLSEDCLQKAPPSSLKPLTYSLGRESEFIEWNGLYCRSEPERVIAQALEKRGLNFMVNPGGRFTQDGERVTREPDFQVFLGGGRSAFLEIDGAKYHESAAKDHDRDRMFRKMGIPVERFTAKRCMSDPDGVVAEFLEVVNP